jgi:hypothetical protein
MGTFEGIDELNNFCYKVLDTKECELNRFRIFAAAFALIFHFEINHLSRQTHAFKAKTKHKLSEPRTFIY